MREEYDLKKLKVKRRGLLPELRDKKGKQANVRITMLSLTEFDGLIKQARSQAKAAGLKKSDIENTMMQARKKK